jgi:hypothetical protein
MRVVAVCVAVLGAGWATEAWSQSYRPPRLADGRPDLQGTWHLSNLTTLERMPGFERLVISPEEAATIEATIAGLRRNQPSGGQAEVFDEIRRVEPVRGRLRSSIIVDPANGLLPGNDSFKQKAAGFRAGFSVADGPEHRPPAERCLSAPSVVPPMQAMPDLNLHQIVQTADAVLVFSEWNHEARVVRLKDRHTHAAVTSWLGDSIGRWEGDTLVVETKYFAPTSETRFTALVLYFVSPLTVVTERFTRTAADELHYEFIVHDPTLYTQPWRGENRLVRSNEQLFEFACHEGNYALGFILTGARVRETQ